MFGLYASYDKQLQGRNAQRRKVANHTYLERRGDVIAVRLHATDVVTIDPNDTVTLDSGGWRTVTTKERMTRFGPVRVWSDKGIWYVSTRNGSPGRYFDGIRISDTNAILNPLASDAVERADAERKETEKAIRAYAKRCGAERPMPDNGDCWLCLFDTENADCLASHLAEGYVHGSLIVRALKAKGYRDPAFIFAVDSDGRMISAAVRTYLSRNLLPDRETMR